MALWDFAWEGSIWEYSDKAAVALEIKVQA
ncbi:MAG: hypothetical protein MAG451_02742 [Anaerolineales bacterium]|nr:hypothetical protein [Anaerolineales bacterium]